MYLHLVTFFGPGNRYDMKTFVTPDQIPTTKEWNDFTQGLFGNKTYSWIVINVLTTKSE